MPDAIAVTTHFEPLFIDDFPGALGRRFAIHHRPTGGATRGLVLYVHPFAEEMNKSRRMAAMQARALAERGFAVLQIDLMGCGDSAGNFGDATWSQWLDDVVFGARWLRQRHGGDPRAGREGASLWLWGLRAGALLTAEAAPRIGEPCNFLFWQPATSGKAVLQQFLRLKVASELLAGQARGVTEQLRAEINAGRTVEVAGYALHPDLCNGLQRATLDPPAIPGRVEWLELQMREDSTPSPVATGAVATWQSAGWAARLRTVQGPPFWQTAEIEDAPALLPATVSALDELQTAGRKTPTAASAPAMPPREGADA